MTWFAKRRRVRVHFLPSPGVELADFEGVLAGKTGGHYLLLAPRMLQDGGRSFTLEHAVELPADRVWFMERLP